MSKQSIAIPCKTVGPIHIHTDQNDTALHFHAPLATFEKPVWFAVSRGARLSRQGNPIYTYCLGEQMTRSIVFTSASAASAISLKTSIQSHFNDLCQLVAQTSKYATLTKLDFTHLGNKLYCRCYYTTGDAAGHNMVTKASDAIGQHIASWPGDHRYLSVSANLCTDKKVSSINPHEGRGKKMLAEITLDRSVIEKVLHTTPEALVELHITKNLAGSILAGSLHSANAHVANTLLAFYLATGQDAANIVEGSQAMVHTEMQGNDQLYFSVTLPSLVIGSVGQGKNDGDTYQNIQAIAHEHPVNSQTLAHVCAAAVLCSELSLLAAQTKPGELVKSHMILERRTQT